jgi:polyphosphate:AMP phosphotransferase
MFEAAELGRKVSKQDYEVQVPELRAGLLQAQQELRKSGVPVIVIVSGPDGAGKGETVNRLHEWLDPRGLETHVFGVEPDSDEERQRPPYWRFWRALPARGRIGILFGSWYTPPIVRRVYGEISRAELEVELGRIAFFEQMLAADGALIVKFWLHITKKAQRKRLEQLESRSKTRWRVSPVDWKHVKLYEPFQKVDERAISRTDAAWAPWHVVEAADDRYRYLTVGSSLLDALKGALSGARAAPSPRAAASTKTPLGPAASVSVLDRVDLGKRLTDAEYERRMPKLQARFGKLVRAAAGKKRSSVFVFEGWDAAGKGGAIRRLTELMDAKLYRVIPIAAPTDEERAHHYLWRFWRQIPRAGSVTIYDRSWYGRVLVERVEGFAREAEWMRAYLEINDFEEQLAEHGIVLTKFWIHLSREEQLRRFKDRQETAYKQHKITDEDWRNREKWDAYEAAVNDMVVHTSTRHAPWTLVAGNDKRLARVQVLETACERIEEAL